MAETAKAVLELLEQLRKERDDLNLLIQGLEKRLGISQEPHAERDSNTSQPHIKISVESIPVGFFHNLSQAAAAEKLLALNPGHPLKTSEILEAFRKSGMEINSKNAIQILYTTLKRSRKFERIAGKAWGLAEWYPEKKKREEKHEIVIGT